MMGRQATGREQLFYTFCLENHVPEDHLLRGIHQFLDLSCFRQHMEPFYSPIGRPSIDPELMIRLLMVGYCFGIVAGSVNPHKFGGSKVGESADGVDDTGAMNAPVSYRD